jgi:G3E family GTPase
MVELQNGCACCSKSEELLSSVSELVMLSDLKGEELPVGFHHIVVEMSKVLVDPKSVHAKFQEAVLYDMPLMVDRVRLDTMVTVIDCSSFLNYLVSGKAITPNKAPALFYPDGKVPPLRTPATTNTDWMDDLPAPLLDALLADDAAYGSDDNNGVEIVDSGVSEHLVGQTETADVILLNKVDLISTRRRRSSGIRPRRGWW